LKEEEKSVVDWRDLTPVTTGRRERIKE